MNNSFGTILIAFTQAGDLGFVKGNVITENFRNRKINKTIQLQSVFPSYHRLDVFHVCKANFQNISIAFCSQDCLLNCEKVKHFLKNIKSHFTDANGLREKQILTENLSKFKFL